MTPVVVLGAMLSAGLLLPLAAALAMSLVRGALARSVAKAAAQTERDYIDHGLPPP